MELLDAMLKRRSVRKFKDDDISDEKLEKILQAGLLAPTSRNLKPCEFIVIKDKLILDKLSESKAHGGEFLRNCNLAIAVFADSEKADTWVEDASIALSFMHLMACDQGLGSCWCQMHLRSSKDGVDAEETARKLLDMEDKFRLVGILGLGISKKEPKAYKLDDLDLSKVKFID